MKKTTIRIAGFLLAAACVALLASCKNNTAPATKKDDGKKPTPTTPTATFDKAKLRGIWKVESFKDVTNTTIAKKGYLLHFDDKDVLRVAYSEDITKETTAVVKTRKAEVKWETEGTDKIKIAELNIGTASKVELTDSNKTLTITVGDKKIVLKSVDKAKLPSTADFTKDSNSGADVAAILKAFNDDLLKVTAPVSPFTKKDAFKIDTMGGKPAGKKKDVEDLKVYHIVFAENEGKIILTVELKDKKYKSAEKDYSVMSEDSSLGGKTLKITVADLNLTNEALAVSDGGKTITIGGNKAVLKKATTPYATFVGYDAETVANEVTNAITNFDKPEA